MRVAIISEHASPLAALGGPDTGGQNTHVAELAAALGDQGHDVRVYTRRDEPLAETMVELRQQVTVVHVPAGPAEPVPKDELLPYMPEFGRWLTRHWQDGLWRPDVAHAHFWMSGLAALAAGRQTGVPVVQTYHALGTVKRRHQGSADTSPPRRIRYERMLGDSVDRVIAQCADEVNELTRMGVARSAITVVPSGVNQRIFTPDGPAARRDPGRLRLLGVGRLVERKGFQDAVRALRAVPGAEYVLLGGPPAARLSDDGFARRLCALAEAEGVADRVHLVGAVPRADMPRWYRSADLLVATPWYEPFGLTPLEAMACGTPVVGTAVGGLTDTVVPGVTGDLVPPRDPQALGVALRRLLDDPDRRHRYSLAAVDRIRTGYSWTRTAARLDAVYTAVRGAPQTSGAVA
ncbi:glycosyltransferase [Micromonospora sp. NPDC000442]|uniref:glycosyltransferase n=1 Tax=Micromonospora sp. NPDC000442 TaxID=3364217 RepID=UPI003698A9EC